MTPMLRCRWDVVFQWLLIVSLWPCSAETDSNETDSNQTLNNSHASAACVCATDNEAAQYSANQASATTASHHSHEYETLVYLFGALVLGGSVLHITMIPALKNLQTTVVIFASGVILGLVMESGVLDEVLMVKRSYDAWTEIDPHLLLYTFLPALLCGDAMTIDTHVAWRCMKQCLWLAGPGVVVGSFSTALVVYALYGWDFWVALTVGSILAATDPVAVVTLLKDLGASPQLTIMIQGESLLNDGTAIVLFTVAYDIVCGEEYGPLKIILTLCKSILGALAIGIAVGILAYCWVYQSSDKLHHHSCMVQVAVTLSCAYWSFILSEGVCHVSGVLSTVATSLVLAHKMWPVLVSAEGMLQIWHMIEMVGNTLVFFLSGSITGKTLRAVALEDYFRAFAVYVIMTLIRFFMLAFSSPVLNAVGHKVSPRDIIVMSWGGLRGMVGMALAILVKKDGLATGHVSAEQGDRILFLINTMAMLTLVINAPTCPALCRGLGIMRTPEGRNVLLRNVARHAESSVRENMNELLDHPHTSRRYAPRIMRDMVEFLLGEVNHHLPGSLLLDHEEHQEHHEDGKSEKAAKPQEDLERLRTNTFEFDSIAQMHAAKSSMTSDGDEALLSVPVVSTVHVSHPEMSHQVVPVEGAGKKKVSGGPVYTSENGKKSGRLQSLLLGKSRDSEVTACRSEVSRSSRRSKHGGRMTFIPETLRHALFDMEPESPDVKVLWDRFEDGKQHLLNSGAKVTQFQFGKQLHTIKHVLRTMECDPEHLQIVREVFLEAVRANYWELLESGWLIAGTNEPSALINSVNQAQERTWLRLEDWYILEQELNFLERHYKDLPPSNQAQSGTFISEAAGRCWAWKDWYRRLKARRLISSQTHAVHIIEAFIEAHCRAQTQVASYFGEGREVDSPEEAFVIVESQCEVFAAAAKRVNIDHRLSIRVSTMWEVQQLFKKYHQYIYHVLDSGVLSHKEAEILLHPLEDGMRKLHRERQKHFKALDSDSSDAALDMLLHVGMTGKKLTQKEAAIRIQRRMRMYLRVVKAVREGTIMNGGSNILASVSKMASASTVTGSTGLSTVARMLSATKEEPQKEKVIPEDSSFANLNKPEDGEVDDDDDAFLR